MKKNTVFVGFILFIVYRSLAQPYSYYGGIKTLFDKHCVKCHNQQNRTTPFSLEKYNEVFNNRYIIKHVIKNGNMPPWKPNQEFSHFVGERVLTVEEKSIIINWLNNDCIKGKRKTKNDEYFPKIKKTKPDLVLKTGFNITIIPSISDTNIYIEIPYEIERDTFISSYEFVPSFHSDYRSGIHHAFFAIINDNQTQPEQDVFGIFYPHDYWNGKEFHFRTYTSQFMTFGGGWVPGQQTVQMPNGIGFRIPKKGILVCMMHYGPSTVTYKNSFELHINYNKQPVSRIAQANRFGTRGGIVEPFPALVIPADSVMTFTLTTTINNDYSIIALSPHMHLLGKSFKVWLTKPNGDTINIIYIKDWDFNWQGYYFPIHPIKIDSGSIFHAEAKYDNTSNNYRNPNSPPKLVHYGQKTSDEMMEFNIYGVPYKKGDELLEIKSFDP